VSNRTLIRRAAITLPLAGALAAPMLISGPAQAAGKPPCTKKAIGKAVKDGTVETMVCGNKSGFRWGAGSYSTGEEDAAYLVKAFTGTAGDTWKRVKGKKLTEACDTGQIPKKVYKVSPCAVS